MMVSLLDNGTAMPMCGLIAAGGVAALLVNFLNQTEASGKNLNAVFAE